MSIIWLPEVLLLIIKNCLCADNPFKLENNLAKLHRRTPQRAWLQLMGTTKEFQLVRCQTIYVHFSLANTRKFIDDAVFRGYVKGLLVSNPSKQIELIFDQNPPLLSSKANLVSKTNCLTIYNGHIQKWNLDHLKDIQILNLYNVEGIADFSVFTQLKSLCLKSSLNFHFTGTITNLTEISLSVSTERFNLCVFNACLKLRKMCISNTVIKTTGANAVFTRLEKVVLVDVSPMDYSLLNNCRAITLEQGDFIFNKLQLFLKVEVLIITVSSDVLEHIREFRDLPKLKSLEITMELTADLKPQSMLNFTELPKLKSFLFRCDSEIKEIKLNFQLTNCTIGSLTLDDNSYIENVILKNCNVKKVFVSYFNTSVSLRVEGGNFPLVSVAETSFDV
jgi:hypothetical protein